MLAADYLPNLNFQKNLQFIKLLTFYNTKMKPNDINVAVLT